MELLKGKKYPRLLILIFLFFLLHSQFVNNLTDSHKTTILIYRSFYEKIFLPELGIKKCEHSKQFIIIRSERVVDFDIVILHFTEHRRFMNEYLATINPPKKIMILYSFEPPNSVRTRFDYNRSSKHFIHWVYSYYKTSFFYIPYSRYLESKRPYYNERIIRLEFKKRKYLAMAVISNCGFDTSVRLKYIMELQKYFPVHTYGQCFYSPISREDRERLTRIYKFVLSFENCNCQEYNTEKYWDAIVNGAIPIVLGYNKNLAHLIPGSYINVFDFSHPEYLSTYLRNVSSNINEFKKYYQWRAKYFVINDHFFIDPCIMLGKISNMLARTIQEDDTIHKIDNLSICLPPEQIYSQIIEQ
ncbi:hypothetical protein HZS_3983 [Henneguya salminicola]|nr:hypothetical protein HZS_3983 [Henneguya salminicola]